MVFSRFLRRLRNLLLAEYDLAVMEETLCGPGCRLGQGVQVIGGRAVSIGENCVIGDHSWLNANGVTPEESRIEIGSHSLIGRRNFISAGSLVRLGPYSLTGPDCHFIASDHGISDPAKPYLAGTSVLHGDLIVGPNCWLGTSVLVIGARRIGHGSVIGAGALVNRDLPPFSMGVGNPVRIIRRLDFSSQKWLPVSEWTETLEKELPGEEEYLSMLRKAHPYIHVPRLAAGPGADRP